MITSPAKDRPSTRKVGLVSLGCAKNLVDAEVMLGSLLREGVEIVNDPRAADALIINTCSFIDAAQEESVEAILEAGDFRQRHHPDQAVIVSGCLPQRFRDDLPKLLPEVDAFLGIDQVESVGDIVEQAIEQRARRQAGGDPPGAEAAPVDKRQARPEKAPVRSPRAESSPVPAADRSPAATSAPVLVHRRPNYVPQWDTPRFRLTPRHFAYVKIAEGCNHPCTFCTIPRMRGAHRSRPQADVVEEARRLLAEGVKELNLISQDSTYYGLDLRPGHRPNVSSPERFGAASRSLGAGATTLSSLLRELNALPGQFWIRLLYTHPAHWTDEVIETIAACPKVARYVDLPLQHIHDDLLARMRRETGGQYIRDLIGRLRAGIPGLAVRTTFIVGFPGETREHFETLLEFIRETRFERLGVFTYSQEDGTVAGRMARQVPKTTRRRRRDRAMAVQHAVAREVSSRWVGREMTVLVEGPAAEQPLQQAGVYSWEHGLIRDADEPAPVGGRRRYLVARGEADAPDIDGRVYVRGRLPAGEFARVRVIGHTDYDLIAEPL